jgi:hypothetical protein
MNVKIFDKMGIDKYTEKKFDSFESLQLFLQKDNLYILHWDEKYFWTLKKIFFRDRTPNICDDCDAIDNPSCSHCIGC